MHVGFRTTIVFLGEDGVLLSAGHHPGTVHAEVVQVQSSTLLHLSRHGELEVGDVETVGVVGPGAHLDVAALVLLHVLHGHHVSSHPVAAVHSEAHCRYPDDSSIS